MLVQWWFTKHKQPMPGNKAVPRDHSVSLSGWWHIDHAWQQGGAKRSFSLIVWMMTHRTMSGNKAVPWGHSVSLSGWWHIEPCLATRRCHEVTQSHCLDDGQLDCLKRPPTPIGVIGTFSDALWEECRTLLLSVEFSWYFILQLTEHPEHPQHQHRKKSLYPTQPQMRHTAGRETQHHNTLPPYNDVRTIIHQA